MNVAAAVVGSAVVGGAMSANAAGKAADAQSAAAGQADATQRYMYDQTRADNAPFRQTGLAANNRLATLLGLEGGSSPSSYNGQELLAFNSQGVPSYNPALYSTNPEYKRRYDEYAALHQAQYGSGFTNGSDFNQITNYLRGALPPEQSNSSNPEFGSLLRNYGQADADNDYIYQTQKQFGLDEGVKGINRMAAANGGIMNGAVAKALTRFGNDYAGTKLNESYNRFENNKTGTYNKLAGMSGAGQQATNQVSAAGSNMANNISQNQIGLGNARGASAIAGANSFNNALSSGVNAYQQQNYLNSLSNNGYGGYNDEMTRLMGQS